MAGPDLLGIPSPHRDSGHGFLSEGADLLASNLEAMEAKFYVAPLRLGADLEASRDEMLGRIGVKSFPACYWLEEGDS